MANIKETLKYAQEKLSKLHADEKDKNHIGLMVEAGFLKDVVEILGSIECAENYQKRTESGVGNVPVFGIAEGHCRMGVCKDENGGYVIVWFATKEYKTPGESATPTEAKTGVFGYKVRDAKHVRLCIEAFKEIADEIQKQEEG